MFLFYASHKKFKVYHMDVKSSFLNGDLEEEVYIEKPEGFQLTENYDNVCKLKKDLYGLKQAPRSWYHRLVKYLQDKGFKKGIVDSNLYIKSEGGNPLVVWCMWMTLFLDALMIFLFSGLLVLCNLSLRCQ